MSSSLKTLPRAAGQTNESKFKASVVTNKSPKICARSAQSVVLRAAS